MSGPAALAIRNAKMAKDLIEKNRIQKEIEIVGEIQKTLLSQNKKENFPIAGINIPAKIVSGDFYNFAELSNGVYGFGVADVSGKGIKSSLLMSKASSLYRCLSKTNFSAAELLNILNSEICETTSRGMFVTMLIGIYDSNKKELTLANAGHEPPLIYSKDGNFSNFEEAGPPLGIAPKFKFKETKINFSIEIFIITKIFQLNYQSSFANNISATPASGAQERQRGCAPPLRENNGRGLRNTGNDTQRRICWRQTRWSGGWREIPPQS